MKKPNQIDVIKNLEKTVYPQILSSVHIKNILILSLLLSIATLVILLFSPPNQDEGVFLTIAKNLPQKLPYRDFFDHKTPAIYFFLNPLTQIFNTNIAPIRSVFLILNLLSALLIYLISNRYQKNAGPLVAIVFLALLPFFEGSYLFAETILGLLILLSIYLYLKAKDKNSNLLLLLSVISISIAPLFKQTALINFLILLFFYLKKPKSYLQKSHILLITLTIVVIGIIIAIMAKNSGFWQQAVLANFRSYPPESLIFVLKNLLQKILPTLIILIWLPLYFIAKKSQKIPTLILLSALLPIPLFLTRHYPHYWLQILPLLSIILVAAPINLSQLFNPKIQARLIYLFSFSLIFLSLFGLIITAKDLFLSTIPKNREISQIINQLQNDQNSKILAENQFTYFYYLSKKENLNNYLYITEITDQEGNAEQKTQEDLKNNQNDVSILWPTDQNYPYAKKLQDFINQNYKIKESYPALGLTLYTELILPQ
mgnify:CR=1 FL=1